MCFIFNHDWEKWSEAKPVRKRIFSYINMNGFGTAYLDKEPIIYISYCQERYCKKCGKYQKRYID